MAEIELPSKLITQLRIAEKIAALTGAGISAESGIPTFRQAQTGLWARYRPEELATPGAFQRDPRLVWKWYQWRRELIAEAQPNTGHLALAQIETQVPAFTLITQNVDGLHQRAGSGKRAALIELHGNIQRTKCFDNGHIVESWEEDETPPPCPTCGSLLRPDVVWFGESLPEGALQAAWQAAAECQIFFSIGTSALVEPAASLPYVALEAGALVVEVNPQETPLTPNAHYALQGPSGQMLPKLVQAAWNDISPANQR